MSGMLPGVECARRRRLHQSNRVLESPTFPFGNSNGTRKSFFCLYTSNNSAPASMGNGTRKASHDELLGKVAREAKQKLDEKLRSQWKPDHKIRNDNRQEKIGKEIGDLKRVEFGVKNTDPKKFSWARILGLKAKGDSNLEKY